VIKEAAVTYTLTISCTLENNLSKYNKGGKKVCVCGLHAFGRVNQKSQRTQQPLAAI